MSFSSNFDGYETDTSEQSNTSDFDEMLIKYSSFYRASRLFNLVDRSFDELPETTQQFLINMKLYPAGSFADVNEFFQTLSEVRQKRQDRLERTLEGVSRAIVKEMLASHTRTGDNTMDDRCIRVVGDVLQPEWREHLDQYVEEIDALIWLDMAVGRAECTHKPAYEEYMQERNESVERMTEFALCCLQSTLDKIKVEIRAQYLLYGPAENDRSIEYVDIASDCGYDSEQWVEI